VAGGLRRLSLPGGAWLLLGALLAGGALAVATGPAAWHDALDWQPALALQQPWRAWTAAFVHLSTLHLAANLGATALVAAWGWVAAAPRGLALAWGLSWPLGHALLALQPALQRYAGLSGVLHGGVAAVALWLVLAARGRRRAIGAAVLAGLGVKLLLERPWGPVLQTAPGWDIAVAPLAHATGAVAGGACAALWWAYGRRRRSAR
jgi:rhomboid family GlyGly-CTERM serine protease